MIDTIARLYVNVLEPGFYVFMCLLAVVFVLYIFNLLRGGGKKDGLVSNVVNLFAKTIWKTMALIGKACLASIKMLLTTISMLIATVKDFFTSKI